MWGHRHCLDSCHSSLDLAWRLVNTGHNPLACLSLLNGNPFLQGKKWIWGRSHRSSQQSPTSRFTDALPRVLAGEGAQGFCIPWPRQSTWRKTKCKSDLKSLEWGGWAMDSIYTLTKRINRLYLQIHTSHIHTNHQMKAERPSSLKAVTVTQEYKLLGKLQSACPMMSQNQRVRSEWEEFFRKNRAAPVSELPCG